MPKTLGKVEKTVRGFRLIEFKDHNGEPCSLQESSLAIYQKPGTSAIWLGCQNNCPPHHVTKEPMSPRMHLTRNQVIALVGHLQNWLKRDKF